MPLEVKWYVPQRVILTRYIGTISKEDVIQAGKETAALFAQAQAQAPIHWMIDVSDLDKPYMELGTLRQSIEFINQPTFGWAMLYGGNRLLRFLGSTLGQLLRVRYRFLDNETEAYEFLLERDATLSSINAESKTT